MKSAVCSAGGSNPLRRAVKTKILPKRRVGQIRKEFPEEEEAEVRIAVGIVVVVDVETVGIEVAGIDMIAIGKLPILIIGHQNSSLTILSDLYALALEFYLEAIPSSRNISTKDEQEVLFYLYLHTIAILERRYSGNP